MRRMRGFALEVLGSEGESMSILIVEDDRPLREAFESVLREMGYSVTSAENGRQAIERIQAERPSFIFVDLVMPIMDGFHLIEDLKRDPELSTIPVVAMSASWSAKTPGVPMMKKPFRAEAAIALVRSVCGVVEASFIVWLP